MNILDRTSIRSIASNQVKLEQTKGKQYSPDAVIEIWNTDFELVKPEDLPALKKQYGLEVEAERNAVQVSIPISKIGATKIALDRMQGKLTFSPKDPDDAPNGEIIEA